MIRYLVNCLITVTLGAMPFGWWYPAYRRLQWRFGGLRKWDPASHVARFDRAKAQLATAEARIHGASVVELGTGGSLFHSILFWLHGASRVRTLDVVDLRDPRLVRKGIDYLLAHRESILGKMEPQCRPGAEQRLDSLARCESLADVERVTGIAFTRISDDMSEDRWHEVLSDGCDVFFSSDTLEHARPRFLAGLMEAQARRVAPNGAAYHFVDTSDHVAQKLAGVSPVRFLSFSKWTWAIVSINRYHYCNRLRPSVYLRLAADAGLQIISQQVRWVDLPPSMERRLGGGLTPDVKHDMGAVSLEMVLATQRGPGRHLSAPG